MQLCMNHSYEAIQGLYIYMADNQLVQVAWQLTQLHVTVSTQFGGVHNMSVDLMAALKPACNIGRLLTSHTKACH